MYTWAALKDIVKQANILSTVTKSARIQDLRRSNRKLPSPSRLIANISTKGAKKCMERYCELANKTTQQLYKVSTPCFDDHQLKEEGSGSVGELSKACSQSVLKHLYLARIGRPDILCSVNKLARTVTKWTRACDRLLCSFDFFFTLHE